MPLEVIEVKIPYRKLLIHFYNKKLKFKFWIQK